MTLLTIIEELHKINTEVQNGNYSTDTAYKLQEISKQLQKAATEIFLCCT